MKYMAEVEEAHPRPTAQSARPLKPVNPPPPRTRNAYSGLPPLCLYGGRLVFPFADCEFGLGVPGCEVDPPFCATETHARYSAARRWYRVTCRPAGVDHTPTPPKYATYQAACQPTAVERTPPNDADAAESVRRSRRGRVATRRRRRRHRIMSLLGRRVEHVDDAGAGGG
ncbi:hypothetical protein C8F04DRAFT_1294527 [Mycena alexandri]|uniref:Uncharacterized protein n=1 Tax=Mycena alexandri TaxID=1745969 RepID=A0AAD6SGT3_9AGAR|nr:hypothetical protein C8F04DRAFT_1294527 [Mycena alexandri]